LKLEFWNNSINKLNT